MLKPTPAIASASEMDSGTACHQACAPQTSSAVRGGQPDEQHARLDVQVAIAVPRPGPIRKVRGHTGLEVAPEPRARRIGGGHRRRKVSLLRKIRQTPRILPEATATARCNAVRLGGLGPRASSDSGPRTPRRSRCQRSEGSRVAIVGHYPRRDSPNQIRHRGGSGSADRIAARRGRSAWHDRRPRRAGPRVRMPRDVRDLGSRTA